jgi:hypothetical protein
MQKKSNSLNASKKTSFHIQILPSDSIKTIVTKTILAPSVINERCHKDLKIFSHGFLVN